jgi:predicted metal-binding membrane protein
MAMKTVPHQSTVPVRRGQALAVVQEDIRSAGSRAPRLPVLGTRQLGVSLAVVGWAALGLMWVSGSAGVFGHEQEGSSPSLTIGLFLVGWLVMVAAMMLPSSVPTLRRVDRELGSEVRTASPFMVGYFFAWAAFGAAAFAGDGILHLAVERISWLGHRPWLIAGGVAMFAGAAEMLGRTPPPVLPSVRRNGGTLGLGKAHAIDRIRRCWPLMLFAMAVGMSNPGWMVGLTLVMALELRPRASAALRVIGLALFSVGAAVVIEPSWMPVLLGTA